MTIRTCSKCGAGLPLESGRGRRRKMCESCSPSRPRRKPEAAPAAKSAAAAPVGCVFDATRAVLADAGVTDSPMGQAALVLAEEIDSRQHPLSQVASAVKQLESALTAALAPVADAQDRPADPEDEFTRKRLARESAG